MAKMTPSELKALLQAERNSSLGGTLTSDLASDRAKAIDYYNGDMSDDMPAAEGRSSAVSSDVADTIEGLMPSLMEIFAAGEEAVRFEPVGPEDEEAAKQETDYVNHVFMQKNPGFLVLYSFIKDALLSKNGFVKVFWDKSETETRETYLDQDDGAFMMLASSPDTEIVEHTEHEEDGQKLHDVTLVKKKNYGCARAAPCPPEECGISKFARSIKDAKYFFHEPPTTEAELIEQGFDEAQVKKLPTYVGRHEVEETSRNLLHEDQAGGGNLNKAARRIQVVEHYVFMDYEKNDKPSLYRVTTGGGQMEVLKRDGKPDVHPVDEIPFAAMTPVIMTHRFFGKSIADLVMDIQKIKTALIRGWLDNVYLINNQRVEVAEETAHERTLDDLLVNRPGAVVRVKRSGTVVPIPNQPIGDTLLPAIEYMDATREWRTGVTRQGQGLDPNSLQNQSATAANQLFTAAQARMKLIARVFAETGIRDLFALMHGCITKNDREVNTVRLRNKWVQVDPRNWKTRDDMTINVGLGTGSRQEQVLNLTNLLNIQKEIVLSGATQTLVQPKNVYNTLEKLIERVGLKTIEPYFTDPETVPPQPTPPDPEVMKIQMQAQLDERAMNLKAEIEKLQAQADIATNDRKIAAEIALNERKFELEKELKLIDAKIKMHTADQDMAAKREQHQFKMQDAQAKSQERDTPKAAIEVKHGADEITGPMAAAIDKLGEYVARSQEASSKLVAEAVASSSRPKRARKAKDGTWTVEHVQ